MANRIPPTRDFNWGRTLRTLSFWALLIAGSIALVQFASSRRQDAAEISYSQFTEQLEAGNLAAVEITERHQVRGDFKTPVTIAHRTSEHFITLLPFESSDSWVATLRQKGVDVRAKEEKQSFGVFLFSFLPYLFILGLIIFMLRQMQQGGNRAFAFGKSKANSSRAYSELTFADVAGGRGQAEPRRSRLPQGPRVTELVASSEGAHDRAASRGVRRCCQGGGGRRGRPFFSRSVRTFRDAFGDGASRVRDLFEQGRRSPAYLHRRDRCCGPHRGAVSAAARLAGAEENQVLVEMDGCEDNEGVILLAPRIGRYLDPP